MMIYFSWMADDNVKNKHTVCEFTVSDIYNTHGREESFPFISAKIVIILVKYCQRM